MLTNNPEAHAYYHHACQVVEKLVADIETGCHLPLARAFAVFELGCFHHACRPSPGPWCADRRQLRIAQAVHLAINYFSTPQTIESVGETEAGRMRDEYLSLLQEMGGQ